MLILTRKPGQAIRVGDDLLITVEWVRGPVVRLSIQGPREIPVWREEVWQAMHGDSEPRASIERVKA